MNRHATLVIRDLPGGRVSVKLTLSPSMAHGSLSHITALQLLETIARLTQNPPAAQQQPT